MSPDEHASAKRTVRKTKRGSIGVGSGPGRVHAPFAGRDIPRNLSTPTAVSAYVPDRGPALALELDPARDWRVSLDHDAERADAAQERRVPA